VSQTTKDISSIMGTGHFLMNLATIDVNKPRILSVDIDSRGNLTFWVHPDDHIDLDEILIPVATDSRKTKKEVFHKEDHDLLIFQRHFFIMETSVITMSSFKKFTGGEE